MQRPVTPRLNVTPDAEATIRRLAQASDDGRETGGILLGRGPSAQGLIDVIEAGDPGPAAKRCAKSFLRDLDHAQSLADNAWTRSRATWIGEWHTHPESGPFPSPRDLVTYAELLDDATLHFEIFISIIVTPSRTDGWNAVSLTSWLIDRTTQPDVIVVSQL